jgi:hypothetical protein
MAISVGVSNPGRVSGVGVANQGTINRVGNYTGGGSVSIGNNYGLQGAGPVGYSNTPVSLTTSPLKQLQSAAAGNSAYVDNAQSQYQNLLKQLQDSLRPVSPLKVNIAAINAQARKQAESAVNPLYTKMLNDMLAQQALKRQRAQQDYSLAAQNIADTLANTQAENEQGRTRTAEDVATNTQQINTMADRYQTETGQEFDDARLAQAQQLAAGGLTSSGIGRQQVAKSQQQRNVTEQQQGEDFQAQRTSQAVLKARKFEDLARSDVLAGSAAEKNKAGAKLDLDRLIEDANNEEQSQRFGIEQKRVADIASQTQDYSKLGFNSYLAGIRDPRVLAATAQAYGSLF